MTRPFEKKCIPNFFFSKIFRQLENSYRGLCHGLEYIKEKVNIHEKNVCKKGATCQK